MGGGGIVKGRSHPEGGEHFTVERSGRHVELERKEGVVCDEAMYNEQVVTFTGTRKSIASQINESVGCKGMDEEVTSILGGEFVIKVDGMDDLEEITMTGTRAQIASDINEEAGGVPLNQDHYKEGGGIESYPVTCGIVLYYKSKILIVHPANARWWGTYSIPKGHREEKDQSSFWAAMREFNEETGITIPVRYWTSEFMENKETIYLKDKNGHIQKTLHYYTLEINSLSDIKLESEVVPKGQLQLKEVDWAGFVDLEEARKRMSLQQLIILPGKKEDNGMLKTRIAALRILEKRASGNKKDLLRDRIKELSYS